MGKDKEGNDSILECLGSQLHLFTYLYPCFTKDLVRLRDWLRQKLAVDGGHLVSFPEVSSGLAIWL